MICIRVPNGNALVSSAEAAYLAHVGVHVISNWRNKGLTFADGTVKLLPVANRDRLGSPRHRVADVFDFERESRRSPRSHRRVEPPAGLTGRRSLAA